MCVNIKLVVVLDIFVYIKLLFEMILYDKMSWIVYMNVCVVLGNGATKQLFKSLHNYCHVYVCV